MKIEILDVVIVGLIAAGLFVFVGVLSSLLHIGMLLAFVVIVVLVGLAAGVYKLIR